MAKVFTSPEANALTIGVHDAIVNDELIKGIPTQIVFIPNDVDPTASEPDYLTEYHPGTFAVPYGGSAVYQKDDTGAWVAFGQGGGE